MKIKVLFTTAVSPLFKAFIAVSKVWGDEAASTTTTSSFWKKLTPKHKESAIIKHENI